MLLVYPFPMYRDSNESCTEACETFSCFATSQMGSAHLVGIPKSASYLIIAKVDGTWSASGLMTDGRVADNSSDNM